jgi:hypothetical protein
MSETDSDRTKALDLLTIFQARILPGAIRRISAWKGISSPLMREWQEDISQELILDCLEHAQTVLRLSERGRHTRWMRTAERTIYRQRRLLALQRTGDEEAIQAPPDQPLAPELEIEVSKITTLSNGRANVIASIESTGHPRRQIRHKLDVLAKKLGWDEERQNFWQARVGEALTGLAADLLREQHPIQTSNAAHKPLNKAKRHSRLRQLARRFPVQPSTLLVRRALQPWIRGSPQPCVDPRTLLEVAVSLQPTASASWLWLFEACCYSGDFARALTSLRAASQIPNAARAPVLLGRARLLEARGHYQRGVRLMQRAAQRWPSEGLLTRSLALLCDK